MVTSNLRFFLWQRPWNNNSICREVLRIFQDWCSAFGKLLGVRITWQAFGLPVSNWVEDKRSRVNGLISLNQFTVNSCETSKYLFSVFEYLAFCTVSYNNNKNTYNLPVFVKFWRSWRGTKYKPENDNSLLWEFIKHFF